MAFRTLPYCLSQVLWLFYFLVPLVFSLIFRHKNGGQVIRSTKAPLFDPDLDPLVFAHVTDIHISTTDHSIETISKLFEHVNRFSPEFVLLTGDLSDNYNHKAAPRFGGQVEEYWKHYYELISNLSAPVYDVAGNHDMWGVRRFDSENNNVLDYSGAHKRNETKTWEEFVVKKVVHGKYTIVLVNPFEFPTARAPMLFWMCPPRATLDLIEQTIRESENVILASHYPSDMWCELAKSSSGLRFRDMVEIPNVIAHIAGHSHPRTVAVQHIGSTGGLELIGPVAYKRKKFGIVTVDNGKIAWTEARSEDHQEPLIVVSHPVPKTQITPHENFADLNTEVRLIAFTDKVLNIEVSGAVVGQMTRTRQLVNGAWLYTHPLNLSSGLDYEIHFSGDFNGSVEFTVADEYKQVKEEGPLFPRTIRMLIYLLPPFFLVAAVIVFPLRCLACTSAEEWIEGESDESAWLLSIFAGFLLVRTRVLRLPIALRVAFFIAVMWPLALPTVFFTVEGALGVIWSYGYVIDGKAIRLYYGWFFSFFYLASVVVLPMIFANGIAVKHVRSILGHLADLVFAGVGLCVQLYVLIRLVAETCGYVCMWFSPGFVLIPLVLYSMMLYYAYCAKTPGGIRYKKHQSLVEFGA